MTLQPLALLQLSACTSFLGEVRQFRIFRVMSPCRPGTLPPRRLLVRNGRLLHEQKQPVRLEERAEQLVFALKRAELELLEWSLGIQYSELNQRFPLERKCRGMAGRSNRVESFESAHVLIIASTAGHAHISTSLKLAKELNKRGVTITLAARQSKIEKVKTLSSLGNLSYFHLLGLPDIEEPGWNPSLESLQMKKCFQPYAEKLVADRKAGILGPTCMLVDKYLPWTKDFADELEIPLYILFSNCAMYARLLQALRDSYSRGVIRIVDEKFVNVGVLVNDPGLEFMLPGDIPWSIYASPGANIATGELMAEAAGIVVNSFVELELNSIHAFLQSGGNSVKVPKLYAVGPLSNYAEKNDVDEGSLSMPGDNGSGSRCLEWLDTQADSSVLYINLGSWVPMLAPQIHELALALESANQGFLWILPRRPRYDNYSKLEDVLPPGYESRVRGRGLILTGWVPQMRVLSHPSVGGFLSHCGWQSCLETINAALPVLAWPQSAEQHMNARYMIEMLKIAVQLTEKRVDISRAFIHVGVQVTGKKVTFVDGLVQQGEFQEGITRFMQERSSLREKVQELKRKAEEAVAVGGSSHIALQELVSHFPKSPA